MVKVNLGWLNRMKQLVQLPQENSGIKGKFQEGLGVLCEKEKEMKKYVLTGKVFQNR